MRAGVGRVGFIPLGAGGSGSGGAASVLGDEWNGFALDFLTNTYITQVSTAAEMLFGSGPIASASETGLAFDYPSNAYVLKV